MFIGVLFVVSLFLALLGRWVLRYGKKLAAPRAEEVMHADPRPPVLLLRSFGDDERSEWMKGREKISQVWEWHKALNQELLSFEEFIVEELQKIGPVIAIGSPGDRLPPPGAARTWVGDEDWQTRVRGYLEQCGLVVMIAAQIDDDSGLAWELSQVFARVRPEKIILIQPPVEEWDAKLRWTAFRQYCIRLLPTYQGDEIAAGFHPNGICLVVRAESTRPADYREYQKALHSLTHRGGRSVTRQRKQPVQGRKVTRRGTKQDPIEEEAWRLLNEGLDSSGPASAP